MCSQGLSPYHDFGSNISLDRRTAMTSNSEHANFAGSTLQAKTGLLLFPPAQSALPYTLKK